MLPGGYAAIQICRFFVIDHQSILLIPSSLFNQLFITKVFKDNNISISALVIIVIVLPLQIV